MYKVIAEFVDLQDEVKGKYQEYNVGDIYPRKGYSPSPERIDELSSQDNRLRTVLIREEKEDVGKTEKASKSSGKSGSK